MYNVYNANKKHGFLDGYLAQKEFDLPYTLRLALNKIHEVVKTHKINIGLAAHRVNKNFKKRRDIDFTDEFLKSKYLQRLAFIKNGLAEYEKFCIEQRRKQVEPNVIEEPKYCECGCGTEIPKNRRFVHGHNARCRTTDQNIKLAENMRNQKFVKNTSNVIRIKDRIS